MDELHPQSPEERRKQLADIHARYGKRIADQVATRNHWTARAWEVTKRIAVGVYNDGFIHAGNLAYISLLALFPFFILAAAVANLVGQSEDAQLTVVNVLARLPPDVAHVLAAPVAEVLEARTGTLLWFGAAVGLWTAASFIETIRDILRRAYGVRLSGSFWQYRLGSLAFIIGAVLLLLAAFGATVALTSFHHLIVDALPFSSGLGHRLGVYRIIPAVTLFVTFYALFFALTPSRYRKIKCRKWPGALLVTAWWMWTVEALPWAIGLFGGYAITYGSLAGVMVALIFFFVIGLGVVTGAELNAALAEPGDKALEGETYVGPYSGELEVEAPAEDEKQGASAA